MRYYIEAFCHGMWLPVEIDQSPEECNTFNTVTDAEMAMEGCYVMGGGEYRIAEDADNNE